MIFADVKTRKIPKNAATVRIPGGILAENIFPAKAQSRKGEPFSYAAALCAFAPLRAEISCNFCLTQVF